MTDDKKLNLSRRKVLGGLGTIGVASAGAGLGTSAYFSDTESFTENELVAGELDLFVDYTTSVDQGSATVNGNTTGTGQIDGGVSKEYVINDVKPGDSGKLVFCPKVVDNPAWVFVGSSGVTDSENGQTEPEEDVDESPGGELSESIQVSVSYCELVDGEYSIIHEMNNPPDYTLADLALDLQTGFLLDGQGPGDGQTEPYPGSSNKGTQEGPCICIDWNVPTTVGNEIQTDSVVFDVVFEAIQERHNSTPTNPFVDESFGPTPYQIPVASDETLPSTQDTVVINDATNVPLADDSTGELTVTGPHEFVEAGDGNTHNDAYGGQLSVDTFYGDSNIIIQVEVDDSQNWPSGKGLSDASYARSNLPFIFTLPGGSMFQVQWFGGNFTDQLGNGERFAYQIDDGSGWSGPQPLSDIPGLSAAKSGETFTFVIPKGVNLGASGVQMTTGESYSFETFPSAGGESPYGYLAGSGTVQ